MICKRCAREIDDSLAVCPICGLDQHRPRGTDTPDTGWGRFKDRFVFYGDDDYSEEAMQNRTPYGVSPRFRGMALIMIIGAALVLMFIVIATVR